MAQATPTRERPHLLTLPPELLVKILQRLDVASIAHFRQVCSFADLFVAESAEAIYKALWYSYGFDLPLTTSSSAPIEPAARPTAGTDAQGDSALEAALESYRNTTMDLKQIDSWEELARHRVCLDKTWNEGACTSRATPLAQSQKEPPALIPELVQGFWRFKLDLEAKMFITTGVRGGVQAYNRHGFLNWRVSKSPRNLDGRWPHVETSENQIVLHLRENDFVLFSGTHITPSSPPSSPSVLRDLSVLSDQTVGQPTYSATSIFSLASDCRATKFRYPFFVAVSTAARKVFIVDVRTHSTRSVDISSLFDEAAAHFDPQIHYVEFDSEFVFIAGHIAVTVWRYDEMEGGEQVCVLMQVEMGPSSVGLQGVDPEDMDWSAVHWDTKGNLVCINEQGGLLWMRDYSNVLKSKDRDTRIESTILLRFDQSLVQLCLENGRAAFVTTEPGVRPCLWLMNLQEFDASTLAGFPHPILIDSHIPSPTFPTRIEMDADSIYLLGNTSLARRSHEFQASIYDKLVTWRSYTYDGHYMDVDGLAGVVPNSTREREHELLCDAIIRYSFL